jgi:hypothetical protein
MTELLLVNALGTHVLPHGMRLVRGNYLSCDLCGGLWLAGFYRSSFHRCRKDEAPVQSGTEAPGVEQRGAARDPDSTREDRPPEQTATSDDWCPLCESSGHGSCE